MTPGFYTYLWLREYDGTFPAGTPYYAGKGTGYRAFAKPGHRVSPPRNKEYIILQEFPDEVSAFEGERWLIAMYGRMDQGTGCLANLSDGGEGPFGWHATPEHSAKLSLLRKGKKRGPPSAEHRAALSAANKGKKPSPEHMARLQAINTGKKQDPERIAHRISFITGKPCPLEVRAKISAAQKGKKKSPEAVEKAAAARRGIKMAPRSPEWCAKISAATRGKKKTRHLLSGSPHCELPLPQPLPPNQEPCLLAVSESVGARCELQ